MLMNLLHMALGAREMPGIHPPNWLGPGRHGFTIAWWPCPKCCMMPFRACGRFKMVGKKKTLLAIWKRGLILSMQLFWMWLQAALTSTNVNQSRVRDELATAARVATGAEYTSHETTEGQATRHVANSHRSVALCLTMQSIRL